MSTSLSLPADRLQFTTLVSNFRRRWFQPYPVMTAIVCGLLAFPFFAKADSQWDEVYLRAAIHLQQGADIYDLKDAYLYPPIMAWLAIPFTHMPPVLARLAWFLVNCASFGYLCRQAYRLANVDEYKSGWKAHLIFWLGVFCALRYAFDCWQNQQTDLVIAALIVAGCTHFIGGQHGWAATFFGLAAGMKCTAFLWLPFFVWRGRWKDALWLGVVAVGVNLLPNLTSTPPNGGTWLGEWINRYIQQMAHPDYCPGVWGSSVILNQSVAGLVYRFFMTDWQWLPAGFWMFDRAAALQPWMMKGIVCGIGAASVAVALALFQRGRNHSRGDFDPQSERQREAIRGSMVLILMVLLSPMSSKPHFVTLLLPAFALARLAVQRRDTMVITTLGISIALNFATMKGLVGADIASMAMWYGGVTASAFALLFGCGYALMRTSLWTQITHEPSNYEIHAMRIEVDDEALQIRGQDVPAATGESVPAEPLASVPHSPHRAHD